jgi:hypothetical protein
MFSEGPMIYCVLDFSCLVSSSCVMSCAIDWSWLTLLHMSIWEREGWQAVLGSSARLEAKLLRKMMMMMMMMIVHLPTHLLQTLFLSAWPCIHLCG